MAQRLMRRALIAVIGDGTVGEGSSAYALAREVGRRIVDGGQRVLTGGRRGVMEAACRGAHESSRYREGDTVGLSPGLDRSDANEWVDVALPTGLGHLRNGVVASSADAVIAIGGGAGTLTELGFAWIHQRPIVALSVDGWSAALAGRAIDDRHDALEPALRVVRRADTAAEAVSLVLAALGR